jgi:ParB/RepB/Spo0J family partition protein
VLLPWSANLLAFPRVPCPVCQNHNDVTYGAGGHERGHIAPTRPDGRDMSGPTTAKSHPFRLRQIPVDRIRPEEGLGRKRDRDGHRDLCRSIEQFGVLTPIAVRRAPDDSGDYLLIKGQGRTLACRLLGIDKIPAVIVSDQFAESEKVQQFLVENVARLRMRPIDRALLIAHARRKGEETTEVAIRFGVSAVTVRRLEAQLDGASSGEVAALRAGNINLALHAVIARHVASEERAAVIQIVGLYSIRTKEMETLFVAIGWRKLYNLGDKYQTQRLQLLHWACETLEALPPGSANERLRQLALALPIHLAAAPRAQVAVR